MSFYTTSTAGCSINLCFDVPEASQMRLYQGLASPQGPLDIEDVYASHTIVLDEILTLYDESVWALRDGVRQIEMVF